MEWTCSACTFVNDNAVNTKCQMCQTPKNSNDDSSSNGGGGGGGRRRSSPTSGGATNPKSAKQPRLDADSSMVEQAKHASLDTDTLALERAKRASLQERQIRDQFIDAVCSGQPKHVLKGLCEDARQIGLDGLASLLSFRHFEKEGRT